MIRSYHVQPIVTKKQKKKKERMKDLPDPRSDSAEKFAEDCELFGTTVHAASKECVIGRPIMGLACPASV